MHTPPGAYALGPGGRRPGYCFTSPSRAWPRLGSALRHDWTGDTMTVSTATRDTTTATPGRCRAANEVTSGAGTVCAIGM